MNRKKIMLVFGGESPEHDVSIASACNVLRALRKKPYDIVLCCVSQNGIWRLVDNVRDCVDGDPIILPQLGERKFKNLSTGESLEIGVIFPILHGKNGEDGTVQGLARLLHLPCVGPGVLDAAISMDKVAAKRMAEARGIPVAPWRVFAKGELDFSYKTLVDELGKNLFVKPTDTGSSIGVSKVNSSGDLTTAIEKVFSYSNTILVESAIEQAREIEIGVLGEGVHAKASAVGEIVPGGEFYDYDDKYNANSKTRLVVPAKIDNSTAEVVCRYALEIYRGVCGCGMARVDFS